MTIRILKAGLQTTIQAGPRTGLRHLGVPASGAADTLSLALANRLVGNAPLTPALETTLTGVTLRLQASTNFAITGAQADTTLNGTRIQQHRTITGKDGDELIVSAAEVGARNYVAFAGGIVANEILGSTSTYVPAGLGGYCGRALKVDDELELGPVANAPAQTQTPEEFRPKPTTSWALRACDGADIEYLDRTTRRKLFDSNFSIGRRADRMGLQLQGASLDVTSAGDMPSAAVFPGTIQCPEDGQPYLLSVDAQTTGGYPRIAQIARLDRHMIGQLRPGDHMRLLRRKPKAAIEELHAKLGYWDRWLPGVSAVI